MKCFNIQRFKQLLKWTYRHDKHEWMHQVLSAVLGTSLCFAFIRLGVADSSETHFEIFPPLLAMFLIIDGVITASGMHYAMKTTDDWRSLTMLPASNLEKFLARYLSSITMAVGILLTIPVGDAVQYLTSLIYDAPNAQSVLAYVYNSSAFSFLTKYEHWYNVILSLLAFHSMYLLGANFFRTRRYSWVFASIVLWLLFAIIAGLIYLRTDGFKATLCVDAPSWPGTLMNITIIILCYWLSFRLFCRRQLIAKYINH